MLGIGKSTLARWVQHNPLVARRRRAVKATQHIVQSIDRYLRDNPFATRQHLLSFVRQQHHTQTLRTLNMRRHHRAFSL